MNLFDVRKEYGLSQIEASRILGIPVRTYIRYEKDNDYGSSLKRKTMIDVLKDKCAITEDKGLLSISQIKQLLSSIFDTEYKDQIEFCFLFGSYAKGYAKENSDIDLCISTNLTGLKFVGLSETIRNTLHKRIDLIRFNNLSDNFELVGEIMKDGIKIYG